MHHKGLVIYPEDLSDYWIDRINGSGLNFLGIHPVGGNTKGKAVANAIEWVKSSETQRLLNRATEIGIDVEYEIHALSWLLPRELISKQPEWFRMNESGERTADFNCCASNPQVLEYIAERSAKLAKIFKTSTGRYHFWTDDVPHSKCCCSRCMEMTASDEALTVYNAINSGIRSVYSGAGQSYLAYDDMIKGPEHVKPADGVYLEYAPMQRNLTRPMSDPESEKNRKETSSLKRLLKVFGCENSQVLDYWLDNSWFSDWNRPIRRFRFSPDIVALDSVWYEKLGFETITSFACYLGEEYYNLHGEHLDVLAYSKALGNIKKKQV